MNDTHSLTAKLLPRLWLDWKEEYYIVWQPALPQMLCQKANLFHLWVWHVLCRKSAGIRNPGWLVIKSHGPYPKGQSTDGAEGLQSLRFGGRTLVAQGQLARGK